MTVNLLSSHKNPRYISMLMIASCHDAKSLYAGVAVVFASPSSAAEYMEFGPCAPPQGQGAKGMGFRVSSCSRPSDLVLIELCLFWYADCCVLSGGVCAHAPVRVSPNHNHCTISFSRPGAAKAFSKLASPSLPCELLLLEPQLMGADGRSKFSTLGLHID